MNECKLLIEENITNNRKINVMSEFEVEMVNKHNILLNTKNSKIITSNLNCETNNKLNLLFGDNVKKSLWDYLLWFNKKFDQQEIFNNSLIKSVKFKNDLNTNNISLESSDNFIINLAQEYLIKSGFNVEKEGVIDYWSFNLTNDENNAIFFDVYKDNEMFNFNVETCIFYTQNDIGINGNIDYYKIENVFPECSLVKNNYDLMDSNEPKTNITKKEIIISTGLVILISGNQLYCPQPLYGLGKRNYIIVKLRSKMLSL